MLLQRSVAGLLVCSLAPALTAAAGSGASDEAVRLLDEVLSFESRCTDACYEKEAARTSRDKASYGKKLAEGECAGCGQVDPSAAFTRMLSEHPAAWEVVGPRLVASFTAREAPEATCERILGLVSWSPSDAALHVAEELYAKAPSRFDDGYLVALAERGSERLHAAVEKRARKAVLPAAYLALHGDDRGERTLAKAAHVRTIDEETLGSALVAAAALRELGAPEAERALKAALLDEVLAALDAGEVERARALTALAGFFHGRLEHPVPLSVVHRPEALDRYRRAAEEELAGADAVHRRIEELTPL